jgi:hypothetical protein
MAKRLPWNLERGCDADQAEENNARSCQLQNDLLYFS